MNKRTKIIEGIIAGGGIYAYAAERNAADPEEVDKLIKCCFEQCHTAMAREVWGNELVAEIISYHLELLRKAWAEAFNFDLDANNRLKFRNDYFVA